MAQVQGETRSEASLRIVFDNAVVSVPLAAATTLGGLARAVCGMSAQRYGPAAAITVMFSGGRIAERAVRARKYELADPALIGAASGMPQAGLLSTAGETQ